MIENKVREMYKEIFNEVVMPIIDKVIEEESANTEVLIREAIAKKMGTVSLAVPSSKKVEVKAADDLAKYVSEGTKITLKKTQEDLSIEADIMEDLQHFEETVSKKTTTKAKETEKKEVVAEKAKEVSKNDDFDLDLDSIADSVETTSNDAVSNHLVSDEDDLDNLFA
jgi:hypothetical protein